MVGPTEAERMTGSEVVVRLSDASQLARGTRCGGRWAAPARDCTAASGCDASEFGKTEHMEKNDMAYT